MALAMLYPEPEKGGRGKRGKASETDGFSATRLRNARAVLRHSRVLAISVRDGVTKLDKAFLESAPNVTRSKHSPYDS